MPSRNIYRLTWVSPILDEGYLLTASPADLERGVALSAFLRPRSEFHQRRVFSKNCLKGLFWGIIMEKMFENTVVKEVGLSLGLEQRYRFPTCLSV